jgi:hypothetical protein
MDRDARAHTMDAGTLVAALGAIALLVGLFLDWYSPGDLGAGAGASAWTVFEIVDLLLAVLALGVLVAVVNALAPRAPLPILPTGTIAFAGVAALVLVVTALIDDPPAAIGASLEEGIWISFGGAALIVVGAILERSRIRLVVTPRDDDDYLEDEEPAETEVVEVEEYPAEDDTREFPRG